MRISNSFSEGEIQVLEFIVQTLLRGGTPTMATRHAEFASVTRKVMAMKAKVREQKARPPHERDRDHDRVVEESSVGTVEAPHANDALQADTETRERESLTGIARAV